MPDIDGARPDVVDVEPVIELGEIGAERPVSIEFVDQLTELRYSPSASRYCMNRAMKWSWVLP